MTDPRHALGLAAEDATAAWLAAKGWQLLARRRRESGGGEVDLIAIDPGGVLVALEVRARRSRRAGAAAASVDAQRVARLRRTLASVGASFRRRHHGLRVDLVTAEPVADQAGRWRLLRIPGIG